MRLCGNLHTSTSGGGEGHRRFAGIDDIMLTWTINVDHKGNSSHDRFFACYADQVCSSERVLIRISITALKRPKNHLFQTQKRTIHQSWPSSKSIMSVRPPRNIPEMRSAIIGFSLGDRHHTSSVVANMVWRSL